MEKFSTRFYSVLCRDATIYQYSSHPEEVGHTLSVTTLDVTVPGYYAYCYGDIQSGSHYIDYCLGRERLDVLISSICEYYF